MLRFVAALMFIAVLVLPGCLSPKGGMMPYTGSPDVFYSWEHLPATVTLLDTRTDEVLFAMDVPPGKQLAVRFLAGEGDDPVYTPDLMLYEVMKRGEKYGKLRNSITVPSADVRRLDVDYRDWLILRRRPSDAQFAYAAGVGSHGWVWIFVGRVSAECSQTKMRGARRRSAELL